MTTLEELMETKNSIAVQNIVGFLQEAETAVDNWLQARHMNKTYNLGSDETIIRQNLIEEVAQVVEYRKILGLCSYVEELESQGRTAQHLPRGLHGC